MTKRFTLSPDIFLWINNDSGLIYNSKNFTSFQFVITPSLKELCIKLLNPDNLYSVEIELDKLSPEVSNFIENTQKNGMSYMSEGEKEKHLVSFPPLLNIQRSWERIKHLGEDAFREILPYLSSVTIYTGGTCACNSFYKQTIYPLNSKEILEAEDILGYLSTLKSPYITEINVVFSSATDYMGFELLLSGLRLYGQSIVLYFRADDTIASRIKDYNNFKICFLHLGNPKECLPDICLRKAYHKCLVSSEKEYQEALAWAKDKCVETMDIIPVFDGFNKDFFYNYVFLSKHDILCCQLNRKNVFSHMALNINTFGKITVMPNGKVYANPLSRPIGDLSTSIYNLIQTELDLNTSWRRTRDNLTYCHSCLFRYLCPSPTQYEIIMGENCICKDKKGGVSPTDLQCNLHS